MPQDHTITEDSTLDAEPLSQLATAITVLSGDMEGARVEIKEGRFEIGRARGNDLVLRDKAVSRRHAVIERDGGRFIIRDLESRWGMKVKGEKAAKAELKFGNEFEIAGIRMRFGRVLRKSLTPPSRRRPIRIAILVLSFAAIAGTALSLYFRNESSKMLDRPGGDVVSQIIFHYDKGILYYNQIHMDPGNRKKAIKEMKTVIEMDPDGKTQFSRSARRIIDGLER